MTQPGTAEPLSGHSGSEDAGDQRAARRAARQDVEAGLRVLLSEAARLAVLQPDIGRALTAREAP